MNPSPILRALSSIRKNGVETLLMGGQACVFYGAAEFSRDLDLLVLVETANLKRLQRALDELEAHLIAVPAFEERFLGAGHAVHFRCRRADVAGLRIDVMARLREMPGFGELWARRTTLEAEGEAIDLLSLEDLVHAKKTQRDKDWPMIRRLVEQNYFQNRAQATPERVRFWLRELRTPELLMAVAGLWPDLARHEAQRPAVAAALEGSEEQVVNCLRDEEELERSRDRRYWEPLKKELGEIRHGRRG